MMDWLVWLSCALVGYAVGIVVGVFLLQWPGASRVMMLGRLVCIIRGHRDPYVADLWQDRRGWLYGCCFRCDAWYRLRRL